MAGGVRRMNEVNPRRARLVLGWVTVVGRVHHRTPSLPWLAIRAAIVSLQSTAPKLDAVTKQVISRLSRRRGSRAGKHKHCDRAKVDDVIRGIPVVVGYRSTRYLEPGVEYQGRRDARTTTVKTVPRCSSRSVVRLALFNARSAETEVARCTQV